MAADPTAFVSYRRNDSQATAGRIYDTLTREFGRDRVFMDVDTIPPGADFAAAIERSISASDVVIVVMGNGWLGAVPNGPRRIDDPDDFVRLEVEAAIEQGKPIVPVLVDGATMPSAAELPPSLVELTRRNALELRHARYGVDVQDLIRAARSLAGQLEAAPETTHTRTAPRYAWIALPILLGAGVGAALLVWTHGTGTPSPVGSLTMTADFIPDRYGPGSAFEVRLPSDADITPAMKSTHDCETLHTLLAREGGADLGTSYIRLIFQNGTDLPVSVTGIKAHVLERRSVPLRTSVHCLLGAGPVTPEHGVLELDSPNPVLLAEKKRATKNGPEVWEPDGPYFLGTSLDVPPGSSDTVLDIEADAHKCDCTWEIEATLRVNGDTRVLTAGQPDGGPPFRTTGSGDSATGCWVVDISRHPPHLAPASGC